MKVRKAFNHRAFSYDADFTRSKIGKAQRKQVWRRLDPLLKPGMEVLELNCGTGEDAIELAKRGLKVTATDISDEMITLAQIKKDLFPGTLDLQLHRVGFDELDEQMFERQFDLIFSNFGGLNCLSPEGTRQLSSRLAALVKPAGLLFLVYMSKQCFWEKAYYFWKGDHKKSNRRSRTMPLEVQLGKEVIEVWYTKYREIIKWYEPDFSYLYAAPVGLFVPPSYLESFFTEHATLLRLLEALDRFLAWPVFSDFADHQVLVLKKAD